MRPYLFQAKRKRLFFLFQKYDEDDSGSLDAGRFPLAHVHCAMRLALEDYCICASSNASLPAGEIKVLLSDMGHEYEEEEVRKALELVAPPVPGRFDSAIQFQDFCEVV